MYDDIIWIYSFSGTYLLPFKFTDLATLFASLWNVRILMFYFSFCQGVHVSLLLQLYAHVS